MNALPVVKVFLPYAVLVASRIADALHCVMRQYIGGRLAGLGRLSSWRRVAMLESSAALDSKERIYDIGWISS